MSRGDKQHGVDGWTITGVDLLGRPIYSKEIKPQRRSAYKDVVRCAMDPMGDMGKPDNNKIDSLPQPFHDVFFTRKYEDKNGRVDTSSSWEKSIGGDTLVGYVRDRNGNPIHEVIMDRRSNDTFITVDGQLSAVLNASDMRELSFRYTEDNIMDEQKINRKHIRDVTFVKNNDGSPQQVTFTTALGGHIHCVDDNDTESFSMYYVDSEGNKTLIDRNIPYEDAIEVANEVAKEEAGDNFLGKAVQVGALYHTTSKYLRKKKKNNKGQFPVPFGGIFYNFIAKAFTPFDAMGSGGR